MTWTEIRAHYAALHAQAQAAGVTQKAIAQRGGIAGQNSVSRVLSNEHLGPSVEIFVRAITGLGKSVSQFFVELEQGTVGQIEAPPVLETSTLERLDRVERAIEALRVSLSSVSSSASPALASSDPGAKPPGTKRDGSSEHGCSSVSNDVVVNHHYVATLDLQRVEAIVKASTEGILARLAEIDAQMAEVGGRHERVSGGAAPTGTASHRRRTRTPA